MPLPGIISVDDHVVEPPTLWTDRLASKYHDRCPRVVRDTVSVNADGDKFSRFRRGGEGRPADWWLYDDLESVVMLLSAAAGTPKKQLDFDPILFDEMRPGCWKQKDRLADMDLNGVDVSICFPNTLPRFCGQTFLERDDKDLALLCVQAYNDWMIDEWCAGDGRGRLIPLTIVPLWDAHLAAAEVVRCADKGSFAVTFSENPFHLGLPSVHDADRFWDPFFAACQDTDTIINMHIGSSSTMPTTSPDAPMAISSTLTFQNAQGSMCDFVLSGTFARFPRLKVAYSEGQVGWMPYVIERMDKLWEERSNSSDSFGIALPEPPSTYIPGHVYGCLFDDAVGLRNRDIIGMEQLTFEVDYPHADSTWPNTVAVVEGIVAEAGLDEDETYKLLRGNAIEAYGLQRFGIEH